MAARGRVLFLLALGVSWACADARSIVSSDLSVMQINNQEPKSKMQTFEVAATNQRLCTLCKQFTSQAVYYLGENKTQTEVFDTLHLACSKLHSLQHKCIKMVDYYATHLFSAIGKIQPDDFCKKMNVCAQGVIAFPEQYQGSCAMCHRAVAEVLVKLKDPDLRLQIIGMLLKGCDAVDDYVNECKTLIFGYGALILDSAEQFLETTDICTTFHACKPIEISLKSGILKLAAEISQNDREKGAL